MHEQERQLQLQSSSRDNYLTKMTQLEEKCATLFKMAESASENVTILEANGNNIMGHLNKDILGPAILSLNRLSLFRGHVHEIWRECPLVCLEGPLVDHNRCYAVSFTVLVKQAKELHCRLEYVNCHQNCELEQLREKLESCRQELIESRAQQSAADRREEKNSEEVAKCRVAERDLKMVSTVGMQTDRQTDRQLLADIFMCSKWSCVDIFRASSLA